MYKKLIRAPLVFFLYNLLIATNAFGAITIDGLIDEPEWQDATVFSDFVTVEPLTGGPAKYSTHVRMITNDEGIFVAFTNYQPQ
jgi:hypothetical protein